jgi:hypothetical protein
MNQPSVSPKTSPPKEKPNQ